jgi:hypothetical protein
MLLRDLLVNTGWQQCVFGPCIYIFRTGSVFALIALDVDDIPTACNDTACMASFKAHLGAIFKIKNLGPISQLLGHHITRDRSARTISMDQSKYLRDIIDKHGIADCKPSPLPMDPGFVSGLARIGSPPLTCVVKDIYPNLLSSLQYAAVCMHPYVSTALSILDSAHTHFVEVHLLALKKVVRYLKGTLQLRLTLRRGNRPKPQTHALRRRRLGE